MKVKFDKEKLQSLLCGSDEFLKREDIEIVESEIIDHRRWSVDYLMTFRQGDRYFRVDYSMGATEHQDQGPFDDCGEFVEVEEVVPVEKTIVVYEPKR